LLDALSRDLLFPRAARKVPVSPLICWERKRSTQAQFPLEKKLSEAFFFNQPPLRRATRIPERARRFLMNPKYLVSRPSESRCRSPPPPPSPFFDRPPSFSSFSILFSAGGILEPLISVPFAIGRGLCFTASFPHLPAVPGTLFS